MYDSEWSGTRIRFIPIALALSPFSIIVSEYVIRKIQEKRKGFEILLSVLMTLICWTKRETS
jgi:CRISPR/Cas system CMR subunit Cmr4 (Cas7 group RAMP superfamily)